MLRISVIITSFNGKDYIRQAIESALKQSLPPVEVIVVDDCSTDGSYAVLQQLAQELKFILLQTPHNMGPSGARNTGLDHASGDWVNFLDGDDYLLPDKFARQARIIEKDADVAVCYSDAQILRGDTVLPFKLSALAQTASGNIFAHLLRRNCLAIHSALVRADVAKRIRFDEALRSAEDYDFWLRLAQTGAKFVYVDQPLAVYRKSSGGLAEQKLHSTGHALRVLDKFAGLELEPEARHNLTEEKADLLEDRGEALLRRLRPAGLEAWRSAQRLRPLQGHKQLVLKLAGVNVALGLLAFWPLNLIARLKHYRDNAMIRKFSR